MEKEFIPYTEALALKELGFDEPCFARYGNDSKMLYKDYSKELHSNWHTPCPTFSQAFRFFRDKYGCCGYTNIRKNIVGKYFLNSFSKYDTILGVYNTWEEAELECLKEMIKVVKK